MTTVATCEDVNEELGGVADGSHELSRAGRRHVETCLRCQADLVTYRKLLRNLQKLRTEVLEPTPGLLASVFATLEQVDEDELGRGSLHGRRAAYLGGIAAATAAAGAGAIVYAARNGRFTVAS